MKFELFMKFEQCHWGTPANCNTGGNNNTYNIQFAYSALTGDGLKALYSLLPYAGLF